jgi:hypothetical protein
MFKRNAIKILVFFINLALLAGGVFYIKNKENSKSANAVDGNKSLEIKNESSLSQGDANKEDQDDEDENNSNQIVTPVVPVVPQNSTVNNTNNSTVPKNVTKTVPKTRTS